MNNRRTYSMLDRLCLCVDQALRVLTDHAKTSGKPYPANQISDPELSPSDTKVAAALMRINHAGEICAQALYHGQALVSKTPNVQQAMYVAALEEGDHLNWCKTRLDELHSHTSYLNPLWYAGSFCIGMVAGMIGDDWSLGFVAETERQVVKHLQTHLTVLPTEDVRSTVILQQMEQDEGHHRDEAIANGARELPLPLKQGMTLTAKIMVKTAYWI